MKVKFSTEEFFKKCSVKLVYRRRGTGTKYASLGIVGIGKNTPGFNLDFCLCDTSRANKII
jgi:hypothetical protein